MKIKEISEATKLKQYADALDALGEIKRNVKIEGGEIRPASFWWRVLWRLLRPILAVALRHISEKLEKPIKDIL